MAVSLLKRTVEIDRPLITSRYLTQSYTVNANSVKWTEFTVPTLDGYTPVAVVNPDTGSNGANIVWGTYGLYGFRVRNMSSAAVTATAAFTIVYFRNDIYTR